MSFFHNKTVFNRCKFIFFFFQAEDGIRDIGVTGVQTCALPIYLHMHPELGNQEFRTTAAIKERLERAGLKPRVLPVGPGLVCDIGLEGEQWEGGPSMLALRADIDGLPIPDMKADCPYRSTVPDRAHACGHDVPPTVVLGAGLVLADLHRRGQLPRP